MTERLSSWDPVTKKNRGVPSTNLTNVYKRWGEGRHGPILTGSIMIDYDQLEAPGNLIIPPGAAFGCERFEAFKNIAHHAKAVGSLISGQVSHPGQQVADTINSDPVSASDIQLQVDFWGKTFVKLHPATASQEEIKTIAANFTHAAKFLHKAGFDGMKLHGAHGYLLAQFLSESTKQKTEQSLRNRA